MPQENQVLRCYCCLAFQVHLVKKEKKWQCKICNSKQSVKQIYGKGSGRDCRLHVMKLNELQFSGHSTNNLDGEKLNDLEVQDLRPATKTFTMNDIKQESKWTEFMDKVDDEMSDVNEEMSSEIVENEFFNKKKRKLNKHASYCTSGMNFDLTEKHEYQNNIEPQSEDIERHEKMKKYGKTFSKDYFIQSSSKWSAYIDEEQCLPDEECENETEAIFKNKTELCQNRSKALDQESLNTEELEIETERETFSVYNKYLDNTQNQDNYIILNTNEKERTGSLKILETLHDDDDLDEILSI